MKPVFYIYTEDYRTANTVAYMLYNPMTDKIMFCVEALFDEGECIEVEKNTEIWRIFQR